MNGKIWSVGLTFVLVFAATSAVAQGLSNQTRMSGVANFAAPTGGSPITLYDQTDSPAGNGVPDQDFEAIYDAYDSEAADDFEVTFPTGWSIEQVNTVGVTGGAGPITDVTVRFFADDAGFPAAAPEPGCDFPDLTSFTGIDSLEISLPSPCSLPPGRYWMSIQVEQDFAVTGQHFWSNRAVQSFEESVWRNPSGGFGFGCTDWDRQTTCGVGGGTNPDFLFQLVGQERLPLYDQTDSPGMGTMPDQDFEAAYDAFDSEGADDFEVTFPAGWSIDQVTTVGSNDIGPITDVTVRFFADDAGFPAAVPEPGCDFPDLTSFTGGATGIDSLSISLPSPCFLAPGRYWMSIQVEQDFLVAGQHYWLTRSVQSFNGGVWRNPDNGFGTGCTDWERLTTCIGNPDPDFLFQLDGQEGGGPVIFNDGFESGDVSQWSSSVPVP